MVAFFSFIRWYFFVFSSDCNIFLFFNQMIAFFFLLSDGNIFCSFIRWYFFVLLSEGKIFVLLSDCTFFFVYLDHLKIIQDTEYR